MSSLADFAEFHVLAEASPSEKSGRTPPPDWQWDGLCWTKRLLPRVLGAHGLNLEIKERPHDLLVLNSVFDPVLSIAPIILRKLGEIPLRPTVLSPRGELSPGPLELGRLKKKVFLSLANTMGLYDDVWFHATQTDEASNFSKYGPTVRGVMEAANIARSFPLPRGPEATEQLRIAFLGRITPVKNVSFAIETVSRLAFPSIFTLYGPIADETYWSACEQMVDDLPNNVEVRVGGALEHADVLRVLATHDLFFLPTLGENFGHAIHEALMSGTPVLISDRTPWRNLEAAKAGWDLPLEDEAAFVRAIERFAAMPHEERMEWRRGARAFAEKRLKESKAVEDTKVMFETAIAAGV